MSVLTLGYPSTLGTGSRRCDPFDQIYGRTLEVTGADVTAGKVDAVVIWGGADISPSLYGQPASQMTHARAELSSRDEIEADIFHSAVSAGVPIIGVCRGAQLACALSGGKLVQHVGGHGGSHPITLSDGGSIVTTSVHHQMMFPFDMPVDDWNLLAWTKDKLSASYVLTDDDIRQEIPCEPEIVWFPKTRALAIQGHPEFDTEDSPFVQHCLDLVRKFILGV